MLMPSIFGEDLFDDFMGYPTGRQAVSNAYPQVKDMMKTDIRDVDGNYELEIDLPGFKKDEIHAELKDGCLTISASKGLDKDEKDKEGRYIRRERYAGAMSRSFYVGENVKQEDITARFENGILSLSVPKEEEQKKVETPNYIAIEG